MNVYVFVCVTHTHIFQKFYLNLRIMNYKNTCFPYIVYIIISKTCIIEKMVSSVCECTLILIGIHNYQG